MYKLMYILLYILLYTQLNDKKPVFQYWSESTNGQNAFTGNSISPLKELKNESTLTVESIPFNSAPATLKFDISGLKPHVEEIAKTCKCTI